MTQSMLDKIKKFADDQFNYAGETGEYDGLINVEQYGMAVIDPWYDTSARFPIDDAKAVEEWGLATVISFCEKAQKKITENEDGFENEREIDLAHNVAFTEILDGGTPW